MKRVIIAVFILVAAALAFYFIIRISFFENKIPENRPRIITPQVNTDGKNNDTSVKLYNDDVAQTSFIHLASDETLITAITMDFDSDGYEDQICAIKTVNSPYLSLVIGLYNPITRVYDRTTTILTKISQVRTFSCASMDVVGNHRNAFIYQGFVDNGNSVLKIFFGKRNKAGELIVDKIGDFEADGSIFIQQLDRDESYELSQANGVSFPVWVYSTEEKEGSDQLDQIQTLFNWNVKEQKYIQMQQTRVAGSRIAEKELARIQDGTVKTFSNFLNGLWYKTDNSTDGIRYIFFDNQSSEIIFLYKDSEEDYSWANSNVRRGGMYISTTNTSIENLQRRLDVSLTNVDEIRIKLQDDVRMLISENTLWDGAYKKMISHSLPQNTSDSAEKDIVSDLIKGPAWYLSDGSCIIFHNGTYQISGDSISDLGIFLSEVISKNSLIQCRSIKNSKILNGSYLPYYKKNSDSSIADKSLYDHDTIILQPVIVNPEGFYQSEQKSVILRRGLLDSRPQQNK